MVADYGTRGRTLRAARAWDWPALLRTLQLQQVRRQAPYQTQRHALVKGRGGGALPYPSAQVQTREEPADSMPLLADEGHSLQGICVFAGCAQSGRWSPGVWLRRSMLHLPMPSIPSQPAG